MKLIEAVVIGEIVLVLGVAAMVGVTGGGYEDHVPPCDPVEGCDPGGEPVNDCSWKSIWWNPATDVPIPYWWGNKLNFETYTTPCMFTPNLSRWHNGCVLTFTTWDSDGDPAGIVIDPLDSDYQDEEALGRQALRGADYLRVDFSVPIANMQFHIGAHDCGEGRPLWECFDENDEKISGDQAAPNSNFGPTGCDHPEDYQWYFASERVDPFTEEVTPIEYCIMDADGRDWFMGCIAIELHTPQGGGAN